MNPIELNLPPEASILFNSLYRTDDPTFLDVDLLAVNLPGGGCVDVSWHPEHDPSGEYTITLFQERWENKLEEIETRSTDEVKAHVERIAREAVEKYGRSS